MYLERIEIKNFRALRNFKIDLRQQLSLIIGKNNTGKTSTFLILEKFLNTNRFTWEDINTTRQQELLKQCKNPQSKSEIQELFPVIELKLYLKYTDTDDLSVAQKFLMDLDEDNNYIVLEFQCVIDLKKLHESPKVMQNKDFEDLHSFSLFMKKNFTSFSEIKYQTLRYDTKNQLCTADASSAFEKGDIRKLIKIIGIKADRPVSNDSNNHTLSSLASTYYKNLQNKSAEDCQQIINKLESKIQQVDLELSNIYSESIFTDVIQTLQEYGCEENGMNLSFDSSISEQDLLSGHTTLHYSINNQHSLPETHNGLGYLNLISILFEIETKFLELTTDSAAVNLLYLEEPEAHTHPQLQYIFIKNIKKHLFGSGNYSKPKPPLQLLLTTHSSHIVAECSFNDIIYLKKDKKELITAKPFSSLEKEFQENTKDPSHKLFEFVKQYLTLNRCELFFTDKAICIEGTTERILLPHMIHKVDTETENDELLPLRSQNISIIDVGGAYSHVFRPLLEFLGIKTLIITDIDPAINNKGSHPNKAQTTTNASIKDFFRKKLGNDTEKTIPFDRLTKATEEDKIDKNIRIAYQIPEESKQTDNKPLTYQGASFEDTFLALNYKFIQEHLSEFQNNQALKKKKYKQELGGDTDFYDFIEDALNKKSAFAATLAFLDATTPDNSWKVPKYIKEGLIWLKK